MWGGGMERVVYIDSLFLLNGIINYLLLLAAARMGGIPPSRRRLLLAAAVGALYAVAALLPALWFLGWWPAKAASGVLLVLLAFGRTGRWIRLSLLFFGASAGVGGAVYAMGHTIGGASMLPGGIPYIPVSFRVLVLASVGCYLLLGVIFRQGTQGGARAITQVVLTAEGRTVQLNALVDSGHSLEDPISGAPVVVGELRALRPLFTPAVNAILDEKPLPGPDVLLVSLDRVGEAKRFRLIPFRSLGVSGGLLVVYKPDSGKVSGRKIPGILVGFSPVSLSQDTAYQALVGKWD
jgi:stage II sporulation protein GA (sporulation sigma-E factor processing peptidase)